MSTSPVRVLVGAAIAALVLGALTTPAATASPQAARSAERANYKVPQVGSCHQLSFKDVYADADSKPLVPCTGKHTTVTIAVKRLSGDVNWNNTSALLDKIAPKCERAWIEALGSSDKLRSQTAYAWFWFIPTPAQIKQGAKWLRCDLALQGGIRLMPLPADVKLGTKLSDRVARCRTSQGYNTVCKRPHAVRAVGAFRLSGAYPTTREQALPIARRGCRPFITTRSFTFTWMSPYAWKIGSRAMVCYNVTTR
jgi:hypothetical protein